MLEAAFSPVLGCDSKKFRLSPIADERFFGGSVSKSFIAVLLTQRVGSRPQSLWLGFISLVAIWFIAQYAIRYYLPGNPVQIGLTWARRLMLLAHISCGMVALLVGPWQFSSALRRRYLRVHRIAGRIYLAAVGLGGLAALSLAMTTSLGWAWGFGLGTLAVIWLATSGMALYAIVHKQIKAHQEWMRRSYIATFAFVTFRLISGTALMSRLQPEQDVFITSIWVCWALPMFALEVVVQIRGFRQEARSGT
jgi:hypothetical protein